MITNFHQPASTLLLLVSAFIGPQWRDVYSHALDTGYRFLSYGDAIRESLERLLRRRPLPRPVVRRPLRQLAIPAAVHHPYPYMVKALPSLSVAAALR